VQCRTPIRELSLAALLTGALAFKASGQTNLPPLIPVTDATNYMHQQVIVRDVVVQIAVRSTVALLNLNQKYPASPLTCVIHAINTNHFPDLESYRGQLVEVSGHITAYQGRPQIILTSTNQIRIIDGAPAGVQPVPATDEPTTTEVVTDQPTITPPAAAPISESSDAKVNRAIWWMVGTYGVIVTLLGISVFWFWRRGVGSSSVDPPTSALVRLTAPADVNTGSLTAEDWKQRALVAEAMAGQHGQMLREKLMPELLDFAKQSLVQGLHAQRSALIETQQMAQKALAEMEDRLLALQLSLPERIQAYEQRISELEKEIATQGEQVRELTRATLVLVQKKLDTERERERASTFNWQGRRT